MAKRVRLKLKKSKSVGKKPRGKERIIRAKLRADEEPPVERKDDYTVGRGKPPAHGKFKKGDGRKRPGRTPGSKNLRTIIMEAVNDPVNVTIEGKTRKITKLQATAIQLATKAATGNDKAIVKLLDWVDEIEARAAAARPSEYPLSDADLEVIREVHGRLSQYKKRED